MPPNYQVMLLVRSPCPTAFSSSTSHVTQGTNPHNPQVRTMGGWEVSEQILWYVFLATKTLVFYIQLLQNSIQYTTNNFPNITWAELNSLAQADCFFQTLLQPSSETHPVSYPKITLGSYPNSNFSGTVTALRLRIYEVLMSWMYRDNLHFIQGPSMTESNMEATHTRTPHTKIL